MNNISYFCIVKRFKSILFVLSALLFTPSTGIYGARDLTPEEALHVDSAIQIGLLTCEPGQKIYSLYGHTAIHYVNTDLGVDVAVNYGVFNFNKPLFGLRFVFGLTDYEMGVEPFDQFCTIYGYEQRGITEQVINLPPQQKKEVAEALALNYQPQNREYRYNYFFDNCTTRARDMIIGTLQQYVDYQKADNGKGASFREMIHECNEDRPWARFGNDILLGVNADRATTLSEQQFLPHHLMEDFSHAVLKNDNKTTPLVKETKVVVPAFNVPADKEFPLRPQTCAIILLIITIIITVLEYYLKKGFWGYDLLLQVATGLGGILPFVMIFSQHPTVSFNLQLLALNPLPLIFGWRAICRFSRGKQDRWWTVQSVLLILFFLGAAIQHYAEGMMLLACCLLVRSATKMIRQPNKKD